MRIFQASNDNDTKNQIRKIGVSKNENNKSPK